MKEETGQLPHHFNGAEPYYLALSGETQTGPNIFWTKTALQYASASGDFEWLRGYMPTLRTAASFVFNLIEEDTHMLLAPGSLMIDVFVRNNYTADSNAMVVGFLRDFAAAERLVGDPRTAAHLEQQAEQVSAAMNEKLWAAADAGGDHFITQLNTDGTTRDFVDYDANVIAVANGVADEGRARAIYSRIDQGQCAAAGGAGPQFVSEKYYGSDDTTSGNTGDSWCSMARIGWFDALGRKRLGTQADMDYFLTSVLKPIETDLNTYTWLHERYGCDGLQQENRTMYYFEYPALVSMLLKDVKYGAQLSMNSVDIAPFGAPAVPVEGSKQGAVEVRFEFRAGSLDVSYSPEEVLVSLPSTASSSLTALPTVDGYTLYHYSISGLYSSAKYLVSSDKCAAEAVGTVGAAAGLGFSVQLEVRTDAQGKAVFTAPGTPAPCALSVKLVQQ